MDWNPLHTNWNLSSISLLFFPLPSLTTIQHSTKGFEVEAATPPQISLHLIISDLLTSPWGLSPPPLLWPHYLVSPSRASSVYPLGPSLQLQTLSVLACSGSKLGLHIQED